MGSYWDFKLIDDTNVLLRTPRQQNMYSIYLNNIVSHNDLTCLVAKASADECTKDAASQEVKKDVSSLRYIALPNWVHDALLESPSKTLTVETPIPTVSSPVPTACFEDSPEPSSTTRIISKRVTSQDVTPSLDNISTLANRFDDILGVTTSTVDSHREEADTQAGWKLCRKNFFNSKSRMFGLWFCPEGVRPIGTKWVLKKDERGIVIKNKARLVAQRHTQEEGIDYKEDSEFSARVYKVEKAMGTIDQTLFIKRKRGDFILIQVYVDDIIFGSSNPQICREFKALMHEKFQMSAMESPFDLVAYSDSDYGGATQDHKSTTGGCQFLGKRLISWQCKKQTIAATSTTEAEYVAAASGCGQFL
nr:ribonuclease H-like domain, reverse transcriptase, RNA-dependent DNA polymerase [Tanacetum cinerariifolium]